MLCGIILLIAWQFVSQGFFFFSSRRRHTRCREVSWARRCVQETVSTQSTWGSKGDAFAADLENRFPVKLSSVTSLRTPSDYKIMRFALAARSPKSYGVELSKLI
eukprot:TRINITY_DN6936_c0_g1_i3.p2 TRINITY_DN6936_c0_g1~~TRINITY_DN6936_c0_g1_i3.p2  ORF type:complete len:105 (-),score=36.09 TRINITY_DN6936_c0_g1_i3:162-476(-)